MSGRVHRTSASLAMALVLGACGSGAPDTQGPTPSAATSAPGDAVEVGGDTSGGDVIEATPLPGSTAAPAAAAADPVDAVAAILDALDGEDFAAQVALTTGHARVLMRIRDVIRAENAHRGGKTEETVTVRSPPEASATDGSTATVTLDATLRSVVSGETGEPAASEDRLGDVTLERSGPGWLIANVVYDGRPLAGARPAASQTLEDITLEAAAWLTYESTTGVLARLVPVDDSTVGLIVRSASLRTASGAAPTKVFAVERTDGPVLFFGFDRIDGAPSGLQVDVERTSDGRRWTYDVAF